MANGASSMWLVEPGAHAPYRKPVDLPAVGRPRGLTWTGDGSSVIAANQELLADSVMSLIHEFVADAHALVDGAGALVPCE